MLAEPRCLANLLSVEDPDSTMMDKISTIQHLVLEAAMY